MKTALKRASYIYYITASAILTFATIIPSLDATTSCNSFPKIFGGGYGNTYIL